MPTEKQQENIAQLAKLQRKKATFRNENQFLAAFESYLTEVAHDGWNKPPSYTAFARRLECSATSVFNFLSKNPDAEKTAAQMLADCIVEGSMQGKYRESTSIFALKNRCGWTDKRETSSITHGTPDIATPDEARKNVQRIMMSLGFDSKGRPVVSKHAKENLEDIEDRIVQLAEAKA